MAWHNLNCLLHIQKFRLEIWTSHSQLYRSSQEMLRSMCDNLCKTFSIFLPPPPRIKSWYYDKSYNFQTSFAFYEILKQFGHTFMIMVCEQNVQNFLPFHGYGLTLGSMMWISFFDSIIFHYWRYLQFKFNLFSRNLFYEIK